MPAPPRSISKTSFLAGCQCRKLLWIKLREPDKMPAIDENTQAVFDTGHEIGALAKSLYPEGVEIGDGGTGGRVIEDTRAMLPKRVPLFEPAFAHDGGFVRVDILVPDEEGDSWHLVEVKSGTRVKDVNVLDVAFQKNVCEGAGVTISRCSLMHVNREYVRSGDIVAGDLLELEDITGEVDVLLPSIAAERAELLEMAKCGAAPEVAIGKHCNTPYSCDLRYLCWDFLPEHPVTDLYRDTKGLRWDLLGQGINDIGDVPASAPLNAKQQIQVATRRGGEAHVDRDKIQGFIEGLEWPLAHFDLESFQMAVPPFDGTRPYQQIPFQFSVHVEREPGAEPEHYEFLADDLSDPRCAFMDALREVIPAEGSIVAYNAPFEKGILKACAEAFPGYAEWVEAALPRFADLLIPFRNFDYYHPDQHGSASIKAVLPVITDTSYEGMGIADGRTASVAFLRMVGGGASDEERAEIRGNLLEYCAQDTQAMVDLLVALTSLL